jgi:hypothetical protein
LSLFRLDYDHIRKKATGSGAGHVALETGMWQPAETVTLVGRSEHQVGLHVHEPQQLATRNRTSIRLVCFGTSDRYHEGYRQRLYLEASGYL